MRPVNLLPPSDRGPVRASVSETTHKVVLATLALLLLAVVAWVVTQNQITSKKSDIAKTEQERQAAQQRVAKLGSFGRFSAIKETRLKSVSDLANTRFDWERLMRELALVLPDGVWLTDVAASAAGTPDAASAPTADTPVTGQPSVVISGCAKTQSTVATTLVRLRSLHRATDVELGESASAAPTEGGATTGSAAPATGQGDCGKGYAFKTTVTFSPEPTQDSTPHDHVPTSLGGGS